MIAGTLADRFNKGRLLPVATPLRTDGIAIVLLL